MNPERWQRIKQICQSALERGAGARGVFLECACDGDAQLRREVESLLAKESKADHFIEESALVVAAQQLAAEPATITSGCALGPYQIFRCSVKAGWAKSIEPATPAWGATSPSRYCPPSTPPMATGGADSNRKPAWPGF